MKRVNITIRKDQHTWVKKNYLNLSKFVQDKLDERIKRKKNDHEAKLSTTHP